MRNPDQNAESLLFYRPLFCNGHQSRTILPTAHKARERCIASYNRRNPRTVGRIKKDIEKATDQGLYTVLLPYEDTETVEYLLWHGFDVALHTTHTRVPMGQIEVSWWMK